jgi:hypothetical protein
MKGFYEFLVLLVSVPLLISCTTNLSVYEGNTPVFSMTKFFDGKLCAKGLVRNRDSTVNRKFVADINAKSSTNEVILDEMFVFDDGEQQQRLWVFSKQGNDWSGTAGDVVGHAVGKVVGDTLNLIYQLKISLDNDEIIVDMDDWLHLVDENTLMGTTQITKWGFNVGQIDIVIEKAACKKNNQRKKSDPKA